MELGSKVMASEIRDLRNYNVSKEWVDEIAEEHALRFKREVKGFDAAAFLVDTGMSPSEALAPAQRVEGASAYKE